MGRTQRRALPPLAGLLVGLLAAGPARAQPPLRALPAVAFAQARPKIALLVVPVGAPAEEPAGRIRVKAREVLERSGRFTFVAAEDALDAAGAKARAARAQEGATAIHAARNAYNELDTAKALAEADRAIAAFSDADLTAHLGELTTAWILKVASLVANGENKAAEIEIDRLLAVDPRAQFSPNFFPPEIIAHAERSRRALSASDASLQIRTTPPGAEVYVDGRFQGVSPATAKNVALGDHFVTVKAPGYALAQQRARPGTVEIALRRADGFARHQTAAERIARSPTGKARDEAARDYGVAVGAEQVLVLIADVSEGAQNGRLIGVRLDADDGHNWAHRVESVAADKMAAAADVFVSALIGADDPRRGGAPVTHFQAEAGGGFARPAGYVLLGLGALAAGAGAIFGVGAMGTNDEFRALPADDPDLDALRSRGQSQALMADVSFLVALVSAGVGAFLAFSPATAPAPATTPNPEPAR